MCISSFSHLVTSLQVGRLEFYNPCEGFSPDLPAQNFIIPSQPLSLQIHGTCIRVTYVETKSFFWGTPCLAVTLIRRGVCSTSAASFTEFPFGGGDGRREHAQCRRTSGADEVPTRVQLVHHTMSNVFFLFIFSHACLCLQQCMLKKRKEAIYSIRIGCSVFSLPAGPGPLVPHPTFR